MRVEGFTTGMFQSNTFLVIDPQGSDAVIVDPGQDAAEPLLAAVEEAGAQVRAVLLTHGHIDHVWNAAQVADALDVPAYLHPADRPILLDPGSAVGASSAAWQVDVPATLRDLADGDRFTFGGVDLETRHTPGHTPGHCVFVGAGLLVSGDLIFQGSVGRTDFPGGSAAELFDSIRRVVLPLDDATTIVAGHGPVTTVGAERSGNPFLVADRTGDLPRILGL